MEEVEVPSYFLCPISLEIMRDPVTLATGITYDRESIERWIFCEKHETCPATKQPLPDLELTPNHTLRRLIQAWCTANASHGIERFPTPRPPVIKSQIAALFDEARLPCSQMSSLGKLRAIISESDRNKRCIESTAGAVDFLASLIEGSISNQREQEQEHEQQVFDDGTGTTTATDEALHILYSLQLSEQSRLHLIERDNNGFIESLTTVLRRSSSQSRAYAMLLIKSLVPVMAPARLIKGLRKELFEEVVRVVRDQISYEATKAALRVLGELSPWGRNRVRAVEGGAVGVLIELLLLLGKRERRECEMVVVVLEQLCRCAEGRAEMVGHAAGMAVVSKKLLGVSRVVNERVVRLLHSVARHSSTPAHVLQEMKQVGAVGKLCMLLQMADCGEKAKEKAKEILRLHSNVWRNSLCLAPPLLASYPC